jgi:dolichyl-phosphate-mannose-protein mannosyltransferase
LRRLGWILLASALLQVGLASIPDQMGDLTVYVRWTQSLAREGLEESYWPEDSTRVTASYPVDYPPVYPYMLWLLGRSVARIGPDLLDDDIALGFLIRVFLVGVNLALSALLWVAFRARGGGAGQAAPLVAALYAFNPVVLFDTAYWGQADAVCAIFIVAAVVASERGRPVPAWVALSIASLVKPRAWPLLGLLALFTLTRRGVRRLGLSLLAAGATCFVLLVPFVVAGRLRDIRDELVSLVDAMPYLSVNAHNLWWILGRGLPWTEAEVPFVGPMSGRDLGIVFFGVFFAATLAWAARSRHPRALALAAASASFGFFILATHMHENHSFVFVPLFLLALGDERGLRPFFLVASLTFTLNMALHDPLLCHLARPWAFGPRVLLPQFPGVDPSSFPGLLADQVRGEASLGWAGLTLLNSQLNVLLFSYWLWVLHGVRRPFLWGGAIRTAVLAVYLLGTGAPFWWRVLSAPVA